MLERDGQAVVDGLAGLPGGRELLDVSAERGDVELVGGATRDLLLERVPRELDVVVERDAASLAADLARRIDAISGTSSGGGSQTSVHERFGTASVRWDGGRVDIAARRAESYPSPGALPEVREGTAEEDLRRRDFTVNAIAVALAGPERGRVRTSEHALADLREGRLRVLHERSFIDDPTRLMRLARYSARLLFEPEPWTAELAARALSSQALGSVSGARLGAELRLVLAEPDPVAGLGALDRFGLIAALSPLLSYDHPLLNAAAQRAPANARVDLLLLGALLLPAGERGGEGSLRAMRELLDSFAFPAADRDLVLRAATGAPALFAHLEAGGRPSRLRDVLAGASVEAIVLAGALGELRSSERASAGSRYWLEELSHVRLSITGDDLLAAGLPAGPEIGRLLDRLLGMRLDGDLGDDGAEQLRAGLALAGLR
jgi:tRNA nucleotidyltransferase (CCA-adding enzyme)